MLHTYIKIHSTALSLYPYLGLTAAFDNVSLLYECIQIYIDIYVTYIHQNTFYNSYVHVYQSQVLLHNKYRNYSLQNIHWIMRI